MKKRVLSTLLALALLLGLLPGTARAASALSITQQPTAENNYTVKAKYMGTDMTEGFQWYKRVAAATTYTLVQENPQAGQLAVDKVYYGSYTDGHWADGSSISVSFLSSPGDEITVTVSGGEAPYESDDNVTFEASSSGVYTATSTGGMLNIHIDSPVDSDGTSPVTATITVKRCWTPVAGQTSASLTASESGTYYCAVTRQDSSYGFFGAITNTVQVVVPHTHPICGATCSHTGEEVHTAVEWEELTQEMVDSESGSAYALTNKNYYLTGDITTNKRFSVSGNVNLCFNGHTITNSYTSPQISISSGAVFNVCDCKGGGSFTSTSTAYIIKMPSDQGKCTVNLYGGTFTGIGSDGFMYFYNTVLTVDGAELCGKRGINIYSGSEFTLRSGTINCTDSTSGAVSFQSTSTATISGGTITGGKYGISRTSNGPLTLSDSPVITGKTAAMKLYAANNTTVDNVYVDATSYAGDKLTVEEGFTLNDTKVGAYAIKVSDGSKDKFTLINEGYGYQYNDGVLVIYKPHVHNWATAWNKNATHHWHECTANGCGVTDNSGKDGYAAHTAVTDAAVPATCGAAGKTEGSHCSVCQYVITAQTTVPATGNHTYSGYEKDGAQHWQTCSVCHTATAKVNHSGGTATCTAKAVCATCGQSYGELIAHSFTGNYLYDASGHWHKCQNCTATDTKTAHVYDNDQDNTCNTCGHTRTVHTHQYGAWTSDAANHWHQCTAADCPDLNGSKKDSAAHTKTWVSTDAAQHWQTCATCGWTGEKTAHVYDNDQDNTCNTCGYTRTVTPPDPGHAHQYGAWTSDAANHWHQCTAADCPDPDDSKKDSAAHTEDGGTVTKPATSTEKGVRTYKCGICERVLRTEEIPMLTEPTEPTYSISGTVTDHGNNNLSDVTVTLTRGNTKVAETTTSGGAYSFTGVKAGTYNVVAEQGSGDDTITKTILVVLTDADAAEKNIKMPDGKKNSRVEVTGADTPAVVVGGVDQIAEAETVAADETVTVTLTVEKKDDSAHNASEIKQVASGKTVEFLDLSLVKTVTGGSNAGTTNITDTGSKVLEIVVPYVFTGKKDVTVYRHHGNSAAALTKTDTKTDTKADGTFRLDEAGGLIYIYASRFSTYAIGYTETSGGDTPVTPPDKGDKPEPSTPSHSGGSSSPATYSPVIEKSAHGKAEVKPRNPEQGDRVTVTLTPDSGYQPDSVTVTDRNGRPVAVTDSGGGTYTFIQPRGKVTITASFKADGGYGSCPEDHTCPIARFLDASPTAWYHDGVHYCLEHGLMEGYDTGLFGPGDHLSRAHLVQMLYNQAGRPDVTEASSFEDVAPGAWYTKAVAWAQQSGIVSGYDSRRFHPDGRITREQLAAILWRYAGSPAATGLALDFTDAGNVSGYAADALRWAVDRKIIYGKGSGILDPTGLATRAEAASMLMRYGTIKIL